MWLKLWSNCLYACVITLGFFGAVRGEEPKDYASIFKMDTLAAVGQAIAIEPGGALPGPTGDELRMLQDFRAGKVKKWNSADVALVTAGVKAEDWPEYEQQIDQISAEAYKITKDETSPEKKAKKLAKYLHDGPMKAGYVHHQYNFKKLLDTGQYNCVSSAMLFHIVGRRLGLNVEGVSIPRHVFCRLGDIDIEPTSGRVYPASIRDKRVEKKRQEKDDKSVVFGDRLYCETSSRNIMSYPYYNDGCDFEAAKNYDRAVISFLAAVTVDPKSPLAGDSVNRAMKSWFNVSLKKQQYNRAAAVAKLYRQMLKDPSAANGLDKKLNAARKKKAA